MEYMTLLEAAPPLKAEGLADGYRVLAEFNGTVLAGTETLLGAQFVTWARDYDRKGVNNGHYYMEDYQSAKEDFALRSGLVARERVFDREQLEEIYMMIDDDSFRKISRRAKIDVFDDEPAAHEQPGQHPARPGLRGLGPALVLRRILQPLQQSAHAGV